MEGISRFCFVASYGVALGLELVAVARPPRPVLRGVGLAFGAAGLFAHTLFLLYHRPTFAAAYGSLLLLGWVLAVFYLYGAVHHRRLAWAVFVLPLVLALVVLAGPVQLSLKKPYQTPSYLEPLRGEPFWGAVHGALVLLAAVGVCVGFLASVMYLVQARRLRQKMPPLGGVRMLSLERLEAMNRRAVNLAFPLLTVGLVVGAVLLAHRGETPQTWTALKFLGAYGLWVVSAVLLYLRYGLHVRGRHLALGTIAAFVLMLGTLVVAHPVAGAW